MRRGGREVPSVQAPTASNEWCEENEIGRELESEKTGILKKHRQLSKLKKQKFSNWG